MIPLPFFLYLHFRLHIRKNINVCFDVVPQNQFSGVSVMFTSRSPLKEVLRFCLYFLFPTRRTGLHKNLHLQFKMSLLNVRIFSRRYKNKMTIKLTLILPTFRRGLGFIWFQVRICKGTLKFGRVVISISYSRNKKCYRRKV